MSSTRFVDKNDCLLDRPIRIVNEQRPMPDDQITADIIDLLFRPGEGPIFIDETASIEGIAANQSAFLRGASQHFGMAFEQEHLGMTLRELAAHIRNAQTR
jgi:hypothetical protein